MRIRSLAVALLLALLFCTLPTFTKSETIDLHSMSVSELDELSERIKSERRNALEFDSKVYELLEANYDLLLLSCASSEVELKHPFWGLDKKRERSCYQIWGDCSIKYKDGSKVDYLEARAIYWFDPSVLAYRHVAFITKSHIIFYDSSLLENVEKYLDLAIADRLSNSVDVFPTDDKQFELFMQVIYPDETIDGIIAQYEGKPVSDLLKIIEPLGYSIVLLDDGHETNDIDPTKYYVYFGFTDWKRKEIRIPVLSEFVMLELNGYEKVLDHRLPIDTARRFAENYVDELYGSVSFAGYYPHEVMVQNGQYDTWQLYGRCKIDGNEMHYDILVTGCADNPIIQSIEIEPVEK